MEQQKNRIWESKLWLDSRQHRKVLITGLLQMDMIQNQVLQLQEQQ